MEKNKKNIKSLEKSYQGLSPFSEKYQADFKRFLFSLVLLESKYESLEGKRILDIGSGIGIMAIAMKELGGEVVGIEKFIFPDEQENHFSIANFSELENIWRRNGVEIRKVDIAKETLPFGDDSFDIVICDAVIEHLHESPKRLFSEVNRVLKNGGTFLVTTPNLASLLKRVRFLFGRSPHWDLKDFFESGSNFGGHVREFTLNELSAMLQWSSFDILKKKTRNIFFNPKRFLDRKKMIFQFFSILSWPFPAMREMIYLLAQKKF